MKTVNQIENTNTSISMFMQKCALDRSILLHTDIWLLSRGKGLTILEILPPFQWNIAYSTCSIWQTFSQRYTNSIYTVEDKRGPHFFSNATIKFKYSWKNVKEISRENTYTAVVYAASAHLTESKKSLMLALATRWESLVW